MFRRHLSQFSEQSVEQSMRDVHTCIRGLPIIQQCMESVQRKSSWVGNLPQPTNFKLYSNNNTDRTLDVVFSRYMGFCSKQPKAEAQRSYEHALTLPNNWTRHTVNSFGCCLMVIVKKTLIIEKTKSGILSVLLLIYVIGNYFFLLELLNLQMAPYKLW